MLSSNRTIITYVQLAIIGALAGAGCAVGADNRDMVASSSQALSACSADMPDTIPSALQVPDGNKLAFAWEGVGVQIYQCQVAAGVASWVFLAPEADLISCNDHVAGHHYLTSGPVSGPTWEALDGSTIIGARVAAATVDTTAIPWLLLRAASHNDVDGRMSKVSFVQRLSTTGGKAPSSGCDLEHANAMADVEYTATYAFYEPRFGLSGQ